MSVTPIPRDFWREVPCGHPPDPVAAVDADGDFVCHCGWYLTHDEAITDGVEEGAPGPIAPCGKCGCFVAFPRVAS